MTHFFQEIKSHKFRKYDYGWVRNVLKYGSSTPPDYDLSLITAPVYLVYGDNDWVCAVKVIWLRFFDLFSQCIRIKIRIVLSTQDITQLYNELGNPMEMRRVAYDKWAHFDFLWGIDAKKLVYDPMIATLKSNYSSH